MKHSTDIDKAELESLIDAARAAQSVYWDALSAIESCIGGDLEEIEVESDTISDIDADIILTLIENDE